MEILKRGIRLLLVLTLMLSAFGGISVTAFADGPNEAANVVAGSIEAEAPDFLTDAENIDAGDIHESKVTVDFTTLMAMFDNDDEINEVDREKLLGIDLEQLGSLKDKTGRLIDHLSSFESNENVVQNLEKKIDEIKILEDDIDNVVFNVSKVDKIIYGAEETKVFFKMDQ